MPDYNSDKEGHVQHRYIVQNAEPNQKDGVQTSQGVLKFDHEQRFMVRDEALAREIQQEHSRDLAVTRVRYPDMSDRGHCYHFGQMPAMPWHQYDEFGQRVKKEEQDDFIGANNSNDSRDRSAACRRRDKRRRPRRNPRKGQ